MDSPFCHDGFRRSAGRWPPALFQKCRPGSPGVSLTLSAKDGLPRKSAHEETEIGLQINALRHFVEFRQFSVFSQFSPAFLFALC
jgi:hypothetical protein